MRNAIYDGTSAIMLSGETAAGDYPVESVETMDDVFESGVRKAITTRLLKKDDTIVLTGGLPVGISGTTNVLKVQTL